MRLLPLVLFLFCWSTIHVLFCQETERVCPHTKDMYDEHRRTSCQAFYQFQTAIQNPSSSFPAPVRKKYIIPIVVHVLHMGEEIGETTNISFEQIQSQIDVLNEDFNRRNLDRLQTVEEFQGVAGSMDIHFELADYDSNGRLLPEKGVDRIEVNQYEWSITQLTDSIMPATAWNQTKYYNIWTVGNIRGFLGFAQFPDSSGLAGLNDKYGDIKTDGMVIDFDHFGSYEKFSAPQLADSQPFHLGRTVTHEMGHAFGLFHIWGDLSGCRGNDHCADTPPVASSSSGCPLDRQGCSSLAMVQNYMDYSHDDCMNLFTQDQVIRMRWVLENSPRRRELLQSADDLVLNTEINPKKNIKIYPNPTQNHLRVETQNIETQNFELLNLVGQRVLSGKIINDGITLPNLSNGVYLLKLMTKQGELFRKIVIEK